MKLAGSVLPQFDGGALSALKWSALIVMVADHVDWLLCAGSLGIHVSIGRLVFPVFGFVLAYNMARSDAFRDGAYRRTLFRLLFVAVAAQPFYAGLAGWFPFNVMAALALFVGVAWCCEARRYLLGVSLFFVCAFFVDYQWFGLGYCLSVWAAYRYGVRFSVLIVLFACSLVAINHAYVAVFALPILWLVSHLRLSAPRAQWLFYAFYPAHLAVLFAVLYWQLPALR